MTAILEVITGRATNPAALAALTANTGDSFNVRSYGDAATPKLEQVWTQQATAGFVRVRSPRMHDNTQNIKFTAPAATPKALASPGMEQRLYQNDSLTFEIQGGGAEVDAAALMIYYDGVNNVGARLAMWEQLKPLILNHLTVQVAVTGPTTSGDWSAGLPLTTTQDLLHADSWYGVLGYELDTASLAVALQGPDTGNYRAGGPGSTDPLETRDWFKRLSREHGTPHIPILNSNNDANTNVFVAKVGAGGTINVTLHLCELSSNPGV